MNTSCDPDSQPKSGRQHNWIFGIIMPDLFFPTSFRRTLVIIVIDENLSPNIEIPSSSPISQVFWANSIRASEACCFSWFLKLYRESILRISITFLFRSSLSSSDLGGCQTQHCDLNKNDKEEKSCRLNNLNALITKNDGGSRSKLSMNGYTLQIVCEIVRYIWGWLGSRKSLLKK